MKSITKKILSMGSEIADFAVKTGSAAIMLLLTLMTGEEYRRILQKTAPAEQQATAIGDTQVVAKAVK